MEMNSFRMASVVYLSPVAEKGALKTTPTGPEEGFGRFYCVADAFRADSVSRTGGMVLEMSHGFVLSQSNAHKLVVAGSCFGRRQGQ
jgi:hypothetical protein